MPLHFNTFDFHLSIVDLSGKAAHNWDLEYACSPVIVSSSVVHLFMTGGSEHLDVVSKLPRSTLDSEIQRSLDLDLTCDGTKLEPANG